MGRSMMDKLHDLTSNSWQEELTFNDVVNAMDYDATFGRDISVRITVPIFTVLRRHFCSDSQKGLCVTKQECDIGKGRRHKPVDYLAFEEIEDIAAILNSVAAAVNLYCRNRILKIISAQLAAAKIDDVIDLDEKGNVQTKGAQQ